MYICTLKSLKVHRNRSSYPYTPPTGLKDMIPVWERLVIKNKAGFIFHFRNYGTFLVFAKKSLVDKLKLCCGNR